MNLTQMLMEQNDGAAVDQLSRKFGLNHDQTIAAIEALMPAFSTGLKRNTQTPQGAAALVRALSDGHHADYIDNPAFATAKPGRQDGKAILSHLFGNKKVSRNVAAHAAQSTGIGAELLKKMLPVLASMVMGALFKGATGSGSGGLGGALGGALGQAAGGGLLGSLIEGLAGGFASGGRQATRRRRAPRRRSEPGLEDLLGDLLGGGKTRRSSRRPAPQRRRTRRSQDGGPGDLLGDLLGGGTVRQRPRATARPAPRRRTTRRNPSRRNPSRRNPSRNGGSIFGDLLEPGGRTDEAYRRQTGDVFDQLLGN